MFVEIGWIFFMATKHDAIQEAGKLGKKTSPGGKLIALACHLTKRVNKEVTNPSHYKHSINLKSGVNTTLTIATRQVLYKATIFGWSSSLFKIRRVLYLPLGKFTSLVWYLR